MLPPASALLFVNRFQIRWWAALRNSIPEVYNNHPIIGESFLIRQRVISVIINRCVQDKQCGWNLVNNHAAKLHISVDLLCGATAAKLHNSVDLVCGTTDAALNNLV